MADLNINLVPTSELEAINELLASISESPVQSLTDVGLADVESASQRLRTTSREVQSRGWSFNTEKERLQARSIDGYILVPSSALQVDISRSEFRNGVQRGSRMYDVDKGTFVWDRDMKLDFVLFLPFEELPEHARSLITVRAARSFAHTQMPGADFERYTKEDEARALVSFRRVENRISDRNVFTGSTTLAALRMRDPSNSYIPY